MKQNMKKPDPFWGGLLIALGLLLIFVDRMWKVEGFWLSSMGGSSMGIGLVWLFRGWRWQGDHKDRAWTEKARDDARAMKDERVLMLRDKAGRLTLQIMACLCGLLLLAETICGEMAFWREWMTWVVLTAVLLAYVCLMVYGIVLRILKKRM